MIGDVIFIVFLGLILIYFIGWLAETIEFEGFFTKSNAIKQLAAIIVIVVAMILLIDEFIALSPEFIPAIFRQG